MNSQKKILFAILVLLISIFSFSMLHAYTIAEAQNVPTRNIRVGFFKFPGYHDIDEYGNRSGYGYEYLHEMAKHTGWTFTYVDGTWEECQEMLKNGEIDLLTPVHHTDKYDQIFDFPTLPMGKNYTQLTVKNDNIHFAGNDFKNFDDMKVGFLTGSSVNNLFKIFAKEKSFSYIGAEFLDVDDLTLALRNGTVDAILTSSLRELSNERVIAQFAPLPFYAIVQKGNTDLLSEINTTISKINIKNNTYELILYNKYYGFDLSPNISLTVEERAYIKSNPTFRVVGPHDASPLFDCNGEKAKGIIIDILTLLVENTDIKVDFVHADNYAQAISMLHDDKADVLAFFQSDVNWAEQNGIRITSPYMSLGNSAISHFRFSGELQRIALINGYLIDSAYIESTYTDPLIIALDTEEDAVHAVNQNEADVALINTYSAQSILYPTYPNLKATSIDVYLSEISLGISENANPLLYSILDKKIRSLDRIAVSKIIANHTVLQPYSLTFLEYMSIHPTFWMAMFMGVFIVLLSAYRGIMEKRHAAKIFNLAYYDTLTNLWNLNGFELQSKKRFQHNVGNCAIVKVDIKDFSAINTDYSRKNGDLAIIEIAKHLKRSCRENTIIARTHSDNYLLLIEYRNEEDFKNNIDRICNLPAILIDDNIPLHLHLRVGVYQVEKINTQSFYTALEHSQMAHQVAKKQVRSVIYFDGALKSRLEEEKKILDCFQHALKDGDFQVYYQPKFDMRNGQIIGAEGLIRWKHKELGFLSPDKFIPLLERTGDVIEIDFFVLEQACIMIRDWINTSAPLIPISINQSRAHFERPEYIKRIQNLLEKYDIPRNILEFEITENLFESQKMVEEIVRKIKNLGLCVSMDDFGSGYSSLSLLKQVTIDTLKLDKSLIDDSESSIKARKILRKIVEMAHDINLNIICEGVENQEQVEFLLEIGCKYAQGFFYSKPICKKEFIALLNR